MHIYNEKSIRKHIERQLVAQFEKFVKNTILTKGKPPRRKISKLINSVSESKLKKRRKSRKKIRKHKRSVSHQLPNFRYLNGIKRDLGI